MWARKSLKNRVYLKRIINTDVSYFGTTHILHQQVPAVKDTQDEKYEKQLKDFQTITNVTKKVRTKKPQKPPFVKNFLLGKFDTDLLTFPELNKEDTKLLEQDVCLVRNLMKQNHMVDSTQMTRKFRQNLSDFKALGLQAAQLMNGRECNVTETSVFLEALSEHNLRNSIVNNEQWGIQTLNRFGNDQQKVKYLTKLMNGDMLSATCISEPHAVDFNSFKTKAQLSSDGKYWILNGMKSAVVNGLSANILFVYAVTKVLKRDTLVETSLTVFAMDKDAPGISCREINSSGLELADVTFTDVQVPVENVIGEVNKAQSILSKMIIDLRLSVGPMAVAVSKNILNNVVTDIRNKSDDKNLLHETDAIRDSIAKMVVSLYAMESMLYLTTGLTDNFKDQDIEVESSIVKVFSSYSTMNIATTALELSGINCTSNSHWLHPLLQEAVRFKTLNEPDDSLKIILALLCLQHAGKDLNDLVSKIRNPLFHIHFGLRRAWTNRRNNEDNPKLDLELGDYLHPALENCSKQLEYCVKRIEFGAEILLTRYGPDVLNFHMDIRRLADSIIDTYAIAACLSKASRSYCIGLQHGDVEMMLASTFTNSATERVKQNILKIYTGPYNTNDENHRLITKKMFKFKQYFPKHPLTRNF
ncbi:complex I assembly factor ACAD9, mitochondrial isoform X1 [Diabrotica virgifera virgifera]|uniref:Acyl-CoA dehydrogenase family member 9, mitochondrial n=1 Tax=Diabrotica virgifera virgifera TaxID=50390 RepID=A0ABM5KE52_DIAVI|nr:complex I assembly factor ACAD9, mitochondrial isoform X1 [Diabrotica virgifera virgifera]